MPLLREDAEAQLIPPATAPGRSATRTDVVPRPTTPVTTVAGPDAIHDTRETSVARAAAP